MASIKTALVSVSDKRGVVDLCQGLQALGVRILSTGGTAAALRAAGIQVTEVAEHTGAPEILDGRVKTLHPRIHGGLLGRATADHERQMAAHGIAPIDLLCVNLYPFAATVARPGVTREEAIEQIDIGGPAMLRSAAKNHERVTVLCDPDDYAPVLAEVRAGGDTSLATRRRLAGKVFTVTSAYDDAIAAYLAREEIAVGTAAEADGAAQPACSPWPEELVLRLSGRKALRYGENPHQQAAFYAAPSPGRVSLFGAEVLQGKELSYNNIVDLDAALLLCLDLSGPAAAIIKHTNPCGAAVDEGGVLAAYRDARVGDPVSAFGGIVAVNRAVEEDLARELCDTFLECVIAPAYSPAALALLAGKRNLRVLRYREQDAGAERGPGPGPLGRAGELLLRSVAGGVLVQSPDSSGAGSIGDEVRAARLVSRRVPNDDERRALDFAWRVAKHVKSNAIVLCRGSAKGALVVGVGAGQMSRVDSVRLAAEKAGERATGSVLASDAFFPFRDGVDAAARAGVVALIQPGGSVRDAEIIAAADEHGMAMLLTGVRHFRH